MSDTLNDVAATARIVIGVDYGTTFTSVSWADFPAGPTSVSTDLQQAAERVKLAHRWDAGAVNTAQVPTKLLYTQNGPEDLIVKWGNRAERSARTLRKDSTVVALAKLLLHRCEETRSEYDHLMQQQAQLHRDFILDYLTRLRDWLPSMPRPGPFHSPLAANARITYVFGVPAAWSDIEQDKLLRFATNAGFANENNIELSLAAEPEAMAVAYLATEDHGLKVGESFIVCDAGGGTVDLTTYIVRSLRPLRLDEACVAEGILSGGICLDRNFRDLLVRRLAGVEVEPRDLSSAINTAVADFVQDLKGGLSSTSDDPFEELQLPFNVQNLDTGESEPRIRLDVQTELKEQVFDPVISDIKSAIRRQIMASGVRPKEILSGGGLSCNEYINDELHREFSASDGPESITLRRVPDPTLAVARGLAILGSCPEIIQGRRSRASYGVVKDEEWEPSVKRDPRRKDFRVHPHPLTGNEVYKCVQWFLRKGQVVQEGDVFSERLLYPYYHNNSRDLILEDSYYTTEQIEPGTDEKPLLHVIESFRRNGQCAKLRYKVNCGRFDRSRFERQQTQKTKRRVLDKPLKTVVTYYDVPYILSARVRGGKLLWSVTVQMKNPEEEETFEGIEMTLEAPRAWGSISERSGQSLNLVHAPTLEVGIGSEHVDTVQEDVISNDHQMNDDRDFRPPRSSLSPATSVWPSWSEFGGSEEEQPTSPDDVIGDVFVKSKTASPDPTYTYWASSGQLPTITSREIEQRLPATPSGRNNRSRIEGNGNRSVDRTDKRVRPTRDTNNTDEPTQAEVATEALPLDLSSPTRFNAGGVSPITSAPAKLKRVRKPKAKSPRQSEEIWNMEQEEDPQVESSQSPHKRARRQQEAATGPRNRLWQRAQEIYSQEPGMGHENHVWQRVQELQAAQPKQQRSRRDQPGTKVPSAGDNGTGSPQTFQPINQSQNLTPGQVQGGSHSHGSDARTATAANSASQSVPRRGRDTEEQPPSPLLSSITLLPVRTQTRDPRRRPKAREVANESH